MTTPTGKILHVEHDSVIEWMETITSVEMTDKARGSVHMIRADEAKSLHAEAFSKMRQPRRHVVNDLAS